RRSSDRRPALPGNFAQPLGAAAESGARQPPGSPCVPLTDSVVRPAWWVCGQFLQQHTREQKAGIAGLVGLMRGGRRVPRTKPLSVGVVLLDLVPAGQHQPDLFAADNHRRQKLSPLVDIINDRYGRCSIGFGLFPPDVHAFKGHAAFHRVPEGWEF
ncbi:MAG TPA: hypothetical protein VHT00_16190, partial [Stellaceae bacterium]|nr:hypothetical protein [Stellaceae bacterium]